MQLREMAMKKKVWETFKVFDGKIYAVEAFIRILPVMGIAYFC